MLLRLLTAALLLDLGTSAFAMSIGNLKVDSSMGEPLRVRIAVNLDEDVLPMSTCFRLAGPSSHEAPLRNARVEMASVGDQRYVFVTGLMPVNDPILDLGLRSEGCGPTMQKDFVVLISPKGMNNTQVAQPAPQPIAAPLVSAPPAAAKHAPAVPVVRKARRTHRTHRAAHRPAVWTHTPRTQPVQTVPAAATTSAAPVSHFALHLDYAFGSLARYADEVAKRKQAQADQQPLPPQTAQAKPAGDKLVLQPEAAPAGVQLGAAEGTAQAPNAIGATAPQAGQAQAKAGGQPQSGGFLPSFNLLFPLLILLLVVLVAFWLKRRSPSSRFLDKTAPGLDELVPAAGVETEHHPLWSQNLPPVDQVLVGPDETPAAKPILPAEPELPASPKAPETERPSAPTLTLVQPPRIEPAAPPAGKTDDLEPIDLGLTLEPSPATASDYGVQQFESLDHVLELAEVMLAFGRSNQAIETLSHFIRNNPDQAIEPWIKLLELYRQSNLRNEFEALASDLHKQFNVAIADWDEFESQHRVAKDGPNLTLESLPHIMDRLTSNWGTPDCLSYLDKLLADNRGGQRLGFSLPLVRDILLLRDILRYNEQIPAVIH